MPLPIIKALVLAVALSAGAVAAAPTQPIAFDVGCKSESDLRAYNACAADCKKASDSRQATCNKAYRTCRTDCQRGDRACRARCRTEYRRCSKAQRAKLKACRAECLETHDCAIIEAE